MKIFTKKPLESLIHIRFLRSSGRAIHVFAGNVRSKCTKQDDDATSKVQTTLSKLHGFFSVSSKNDTAAASKVVGVDGNTEETSDHTKENGCTSGPRLDNAEKSGLAFDRPVKTSAQHRLKMWISNGRNSIMGRYGKKLEPGVTDAHQKLSTEHVNTAWPDWLINVAPEAVQGWLPRQADSFEKLGKIGQGTYSSVYKARDLRTGNIVALKKVRFVNLDPDSVRFMAREIHILRKLNHPNVIKLEGIVISSVSQSLYLVFEYMEHDLVGLAATPGLRFTEPQVKCLMQQLLSGLDHCHRNGVLHRDLKGANLLIDNNGVLKIADFGLAASYDPNNQQPLTSRVATLWYRPPELLLGATKYDVGVDMWSMGCIFAELLVGKPIMPGRTEVEQIHKIFKLCGSPSDEYWQRLEVPQTGMFRPSRQYTRCIADDFSDFPQSALVLLDNLLALEPEARGTAASTMQSDFFRTEPVACSPSGLPKCPPSKEYDARLRLEESRRQRKDEKSNSVKPGKDNPISNHAANGSIKSKKHEQANSNLNPQDDQWTLATGVQSPGFESTWNNGGNYTDHREVPGRKWNSVRRANFAALRTMSSNLLQPEPTGARNNTLDSCNNNLGANIPIVNYKGKNRRMRCSGSLITQEDNMEEMLKEHERNIQAAVRKARLNNKSREL